MKLNVRTAHDIKIQRSDATYSGIVSRGAVDIYSVSLLQKEETAIGCLFLLVLPRFFAIRKKAVRLRAG